METLGQKLAAARMQKKLTASEAAKGTRIKVQHIEAIEQDDFIDIPASAYAKGFIRIYAEFLGLDPVPLIQEYLDNHAPRKRTSLVPEDEAASKPKREYTGPAFKWPSFSLPKIRFPKLKKPAWVKRPSVSLPAPRIPSVPPRTLLICSAALLVLLLVLFTARRCARVEDPPPEPPPDIETEIVPLDREPETVPVEPVEDAEAPVHEVDDLPPLDRPLPLIDDLPEPYLD